MNPHGHVRCVQREVRLQADRIDLDDGDGGEVFTEVNESLLQPPVRRLLNLPRLNQIVDGIYYRGKPAPTFLPQDGLANKLV